MKNKIIVALFIAMSLLLVNVHAAIEENSTINMTKDSHFGNIILTIPSGFEKVEPGKSLLTNIKFMNLRSESRIDVVLDFIIEDSEGRTVLSKKETIAVETQANIIRTFIIPEDTLLGKHKVYIKLIYADGNETAAEASFDVVKKSEGGSFNIYILSAVISVVLILIYFGMRFNSIARNLKLKMQIRKIVKDRLAKN